MIKYTCHCTYNWFTPHTTPHHTTPHHTTPHLTTPSNPSTTGAVWQQVRHISHLLCHTCGYNSDYIHRVVARTSRNRYTVFRYYCPLTCHRTLLPFYALSPPIMHFVSRTISFHHPLHHAPHLTHYSLPPSTPSHPLFPSAIVKLSQLGHSAVYCVGGISMQLSWLSYLGPVTAARCMARPWLLGKYC